MRITPLTYAVKDGEILFSTWENSDAVRNLHRDTRASVLIDKADQPYAGVHYTGRAQALPETSTPEEYARLFGRYSGDENQAADGHRVDHARSWLCQQQSIKVKVELQDVDVRLTHEQQRGSRRVACHVRP